VDLQLTVFVILAGVGLGSAALLLLQRNPVHSALYLVVTFFSVAGIYVLLQAEFLAAVQVLVYAGGILVLFLFVIMLVEAPGRQGPRTVGRYHVVTCGLLTLLMVGALAVHVAAGPREAADAAERAGLLAAGGNLETVALSLFRDYLLPFELISVLLLAALVGAVVLAKPRS
jgi:NADH-quinone oxidoreductase subunit J